MGDFFNLSNASVKIYDGPIRNMDPTFGKMYWDGTRDTGYGGYQYDGRWQAISETAVKRYGLKSGHRVLDVGCGKGFFLADLLQVCPGIEVRGADVSQYALEQAHPLAKPFLSLGSADDLSLFKDHSFDLVCAMNTFHFLPPDRVVKAFQEMMRVGKHKFFVHLDTYRSQVERERLLAWAPIIKTVYSVDQWLDFFKKLGYAGDYYWTLVLPSDNSISQAASENPSSLHG